MMKRLFWLVMGVTIGALAFRKLSKLAQKAKPSGIAGSVTAAVGDLAEALRDFAGDVREAMSEHEAAMRAGSGIDGALGARPEDMA
jgi:hypothetical protein